jgi:ATP-dependent helicase HrpB
VLADLAAALRAGPAAVLLAPPGAGKTTLVPPALLNEPWMAGKRIVVLQPRRLAARAAAMRMAELRGEPVGRTVGYRVRLDTRVGPETRIEVVTEGVLTRMLQKDPALTGVGLVVFDELHERHLESDLGLALCLDLQGVLNPELRLLAMSATLEGEAVAGHLGGAPVVRCEGRRFPVETRYLGRPAAERQDASVAQAVLAAARAETGSILVFLPGAPEIRRVHRLLADALQGPEWVLAPLFGNLAKDEQDRAIAPAPPGRRKVVLATTIAETSLTIEGIRVVVDGGLTRVPRFDVQSGMTRLATQRVSRASAEQRRGRAGRTAPGVCYRLWDEADEASLRPYDLPEILQADMAGLVLECAIWGVDEPGLLRWLDPPPAAACRQAAELLAGLSALGAEGRVTAHGRRVAELPLHPRLAHMVLKARKLGMEAAACDLAAVLSERDFIAFPPGQGDTDLRLRLEVMAAERAGRRPEAGGIRIDRSACRRAIRLADALRRAGRAGDHPGSENVGRILSWAYPDRIGLRRPGEPGRFLLANGRGACFAGPEPLSTSDCVVAAHLDGERREARIFLAAACDPAFLPGDFGDTLRREEEIRWDRRTRAVAALRSVRLGALTLGTEAIADADPGRVARAMLEGVRAMGLECLPWTPGLRRWQQRVLFLRRVLGAAEWPDVGDDALSASLDDWLLPVIGGVTRAAGLRGIDLGAALESLLPWPQRRRLDELAPTHVAAPSGSRLRLDYSGETPVLAVRVQEMFGCAQTPRVAGGRQPVLLHLLSPAGRPVQVTADLAGFWSGSYREVRKDLRGRYPKHPWPEDPLHALPTRRAKGRSRG